MDTSARTALRDLSYEELRAFVEQEGLERFRTDQIFRWVHGVGCSSVDEMTNLGKALRARLADRIDLGRLSVDLEQVSVDGTRKLRLRTQDARAIETVLIPDGDAREADSDDDDAADEEPRPEALAHPLFPKRPKLTQCISSQVGCALDCKFCATATLGFGRNLTSGEIVDQVYRAQAILAGLDAEDPTRRAGADHVTNLVFMGMGEPLHNYAQVTRAFRILTHERGAALSRRRITVSTAGLVPAIEKLADEPLQVNLAVSLNASHDEQRSAIMPINRKWPIARLLDAVRKVLRNPDYGRRRRVTFEYVLLDGVNDTVDDAGRVARLLRGIPSKVNVIPWNPHPLAPFRRPSDEAVRWFQEVLRNEGLPVYVRRSRGVDIDAACGQLAARERADGGAGAVGALLPTEGLAARR
jgi:23S rRNA (adenine2503-C2)-methyltransferase